MGRIVLLERSPESGESASAASFTKQDAQVSRHYFGTVLDAAGKADLISVEDLNDLPTDVLGDVQQAPIQQTAPGGLYPGCLNRSPPLADACWSTLYASGLTDVRGCGDEFEDRIVPPLEGPTMEGFDNYRQIRCNVVFTERNYPIIVNAEMPPPADLDRLPPRGTAWFNDDGLQERNIFTKEFLRWTDYNAVSCNSNVTAKHGQFKFRTNNADQPNGIPFTAEPRIQLPDTLISFRWYEVPYRYITSPNSFIKRFKGRINQFDFYDWTLGELLYLNYSFKKYVNPAQRTSIFNTEFNIRSTEKLVDIEFTMLETKRTPRDPIVPVNKNWLAAGHNLQPWLPTGKFYYVTYAPPSTVITPDNDPSKWKPQFLSFPFQLLFTDPDTI